MAEGAQPGRDCPLAYGYGADALAAPASMRAETLLVAGGLYGNVFALERLLERFDAEPGDKMLVFNGDFHWFDVAAEDFRRVTEVALAHTATRGNVETELADPAAGAGCGCGYPAFVDDGVVERSNRIIERLRATAAGFPALSARMLALPMYAVAEVGGERVGIVHGDAGSLSGWGFSQEVLGTTAGVDAARRAIESAGVRVFASSHSCLPVLQQVAGALIANNGAAGMPNFRGSRYGVATRISVRPCADALYGARSGALHVDAVALHYDADAWERRFLEQWPPGSDAHVSYHERIVSGPRYEPGEALRTDLRRAA
ncbi:MAG: metallophosphoesterase family protein [Burkholderiales bacterium]